MIEHYFECPHCWKNHLKMVDPSVSNQSFIEDCETCCNPLEFCVEVEFNSIISFSVSPIGQ